MNAFPPAVRRFGYAAAETRAQTTRRVMHRREDPPRSNSSKRGPTRVRLWLPLTPLFILLAPFALALSLLGYLVPPRWRPDPIAAALAVGALLLSLGGTSIVIDTAEAKVRIHIF